MGFHFLLQGIFPTQGLNPGLPHCRQTLYCLSYQGSPQNLVKGILIRKGKFGDTNTQRITPCEDGGRDWNKPSVNQGTAKIACNLPGARREAGSRFFLTVLTKNQPRLQLDFRFLACGTVRPYTSVVQAPSLWFFVVSALTNSNST